MSDSKIEVMDYHPQCIIEYELRRNMRRKWFSKKHETKGSWIVKGDKVLNMEFSWPNRPTGVEILSAVQTVKNIIAKIE